VEVWKQGSEKREEVGEAGKKEVEVFRLINKRGGCKVDRRRGEGPKGQSR